MLAPDVTVQASQENVILNAVKDLISATFRFFASLLRNYSKFGGVSFLKTPRLRGAMLRMTYCVVVLIIPELLPPDHDSHLIVIYNII